MTITHPVLLRQLKRSKITLDQGQYLNEISIKVSSREMLEKNKELLATINQLSEAQTYLLRAEKMATIGQLASGMAHEINTPLTYVLCNIDIIHKRFLSLLNETTDASLSDDIETLIAETKEGLLRIKEIIVSLNKIASSNIEEKQMININACLQSAIESTRDELQDKCELVINLMEVPVIEGIAREIEIAFVNLLINAKQAIEKDGKITVISMTNDSHIQISIADNGSGIKADDMPKLFTPFFTTKPIGTGIGLGLSIAYGIIELHGGTITVESKENLGSTFTISLPINKKD